MNVNDHIVEWANSQRELTESARSASSLRSILKSDRFNPSDREILKEILTTVKEPRKNKPLTPAGIEHLKRAISGLEKGAPSYVREFIKDYRGNRTILDEVMALQKQQLIELAPGDRDDFASLIKSTLPLLSENERKQFCQNLVDNPFQLQALEDTNDHDALKAVSRELVKAGLLYVAFSYFKTSQYDMRLRLPSEETKNAIVEGIKEALELPPSEHPTSISLLSKEDAEPKAIIDGLLARAATQARHLEGKRDFFTAETTRLDEGYKSAQKMIDALEGFASPSGRKEVKKLLELPQSAANYKKIHALLRELVKHSQLNPEFMIELLSDKKLPSNLRENEHFASAVARLQKARAFKKARSDFVTDLVKAREEIGKFIEVCLGQGVSTKRMEEYISKHHF